MTLSSRMNQTIECRMCIDEVSCKYGQQELYDLTLLPCHGSHAPQTYECHSHPSIISHTRLLWQVTSLKDCHFIFVHSRREREREN